MRALLVFMVCLGCSSSAPSRYERGAAQPVAPPFNPATQSPITTGQPGHLRPQAPPRSPHQRVLPPSKDPGLWSGDRPRAAKHPLDRVDQRTYPGYVFPVPINAEPVEEDRVISCAAAIRRALVDAGRNAGSLGRDEARCFYASMYLRCASRALERAEKTEATLESRVHWWRNIRNVAREEQRKWCHSQPVSAVAEEWARDIAPVWNAAFDDLVIW